MPNLRKTWTLLYKNYPNSEKINAVSFGAETLFTRLLAASDDNSNYEGSVIQLLCGLFSKRLENGTINKRILKRFLDEIIDCGLIKLYVVNNHEYIHIENSHKIWRKDTKPDIRYPEFDENYVTDSMQIRDESETNPVQKRNKSGTETVTEPGQIRTESDTSKKKRISHKRRERDNAIIESSLEASSENLPSSSFPYFNIEKEYPDIDHKKEYNKYCIWLKKKSENNGYDTLPTEIGYRNWLLKPFEKECKHKTLKKNKPLSQKFWNKYDNPDYQAQDCPKCKGKRDTYIQSDNSKAVWYCENCDEVYDLINFNDLPLEVRNFDQAEHDAVVKECLIEAKKIAAGELIK